jgi:hypothetical protein
MKKTTVTILVLSLVILLTGGVALAKKFPGPQVSPGPPLKWTPVPGVSGVEYVPHFEQDLFRYQGGFFNFEGGAWFKATAPMGPWVPIPQPPQVFYNIQAPYFKVPPGWAKGKKTGWGDAPMPPGQMKKLDPGHGPPGKVKKKGGPHRY